MNMTEVRQRAKKAGVNAAGKKLDIIHRIQSSEGNETCFGMRNNCSQLDCCWREDCMAVAS